MPAADVKKEEWEDVDISDAFTSSDNKLVLLNDNHNTFEHVIDVLSTVMGFESSRSEQIAILVHTKGKCNIKEGPYREILPYYTGLKEQGLTVEIQ